jgi:hypothetical protein
VLGICPVLSYCQELERESQTRWLEVQYKIQLHVTRLFLNGLLAYGPQIYKVILNSGGQNICIRHKMALGKNIFRLYDTPVVRGTHQVFHLLANGRRRAPSKHRD